MSNLFNPLERANLGKSVASALLETERVPLYRLEQFEGAGIYCIYYHGQFDGYRKLTRDEENPTPIYIGKAAPKGARKGIDILNSNIQGDELYRRLNDHRKSLVAATNLEIKDFTYRCLVVEDIWIALGEALLISKFTPVWNTTLDGFGNHDPGKGRKDQRRSRWDILHPGRKWADKLAARTETYDELLNEVIRYLSSE
ncbi:Eco29kI family restriction endonuclease [SAR116 cluster bacterium]|nr:Eco29kI family restriction endonuclease [SAR116 cluster bacterium]